MPMPVWLTETSESPCFLPFPAPVFHCWDLGLGTDWASHRSPHGRVVGRCPTDNTDTAQTLSFAPGSPASGGLAGSRPQRETTQSRWQRRLSLLPPPPPQPPVLLSHPTSHLPDPTPGWYLVAGCRPSGALRSLAKAVWSVDGSRPGGRIGAGASKVP